MNLSNEGEEIFGWSYDSGSWIIQGDLLKLKSDDGNNEIWLLRE